MPQMAQIQLLLHCHLQQLEVVPVQVILGKVMVMLVAQAEVRAGRQHHIQEEQALVGKVMLVVETAVLLLAEYILRVAAVVQELQEALARAVAERLVE
jgi:hypothetical protein